MRGSNNQKTNLTTKIGVFFVVSAFVIIVIDMYFSTLETYTFDLTTKHIMYGSGAGLLLIILPEDTLVEIIRKYLKK